MILVTSLPAAGSLFPSSRTLSLVGLVGWSVYSVVLVLRGHKMVCDAKITSSERNWFLSGTAVVAVGLASSFRLLSPGLGDNLVMADCRVLALPPTTLVGWGYWLAWSTGSVLWVRWLAGSGSDTVGRIWPMVRLPWNPQRYASVPPGPVRWVGLGLVTIWMTVQAVLGLSCHM